MDLSKAFDYLHHNLLLLTLVNYGVSENSFDANWSIITFQKSTILFVNWHYFSLSGKEQVLIDKFIS
jgi:hypothetical protein